MKIFERIKRKYTIGYHQTIKQLDAVDDRMESCTLYIPVLLDNTVIVENPMMDGEMKVVGFMFYNTRTRK